MEIAGMFLCIPLRLAKQAWCGSRKQCTVELDSTWASKSTRSVAPVKKSINSNVYSEGYGSQTKVLKDIY